MVAAEMDHVSFGIIARIPHLRTGEILGHENFVLASVGGYVTMGNQQLANGKIQGSPFIVDWTHDKGILPTLMPVQEIGGNLLIARRGIDNFANHMPDCSTSATSPYMCKAR
jgi:hypothetical protein